MWAWTEWTNNVDLSSDLYTRAIACMSTHISCTHSYTINNNITSYICSWHYHSITAYKKKHRNNTFLCRVLSKHIRLNMIYHMQVAAICKNPIPNYNKAHFFFHGCLNCLKVEPINTFEVCGFLNLEFY